MPARATLATLLLTALAACGGTSPAPEPKLAAAEAAGGTRLKARWYAAPEGPVAPRAAWNDPFHDTALDLDCGFVLAGDGQWRCLPRTAVIGVGGASALYFFGDDKCTSPLYPATASCLTPAPTQIGAQTSTCPVLERRLAVGAAIAADAPVFYRNTDGSCAAYSPSAALRSALHQLGAEIDYAAYASAERQDGTPVNGYAEAALVASDGAVQPLGFAASGSSELLRPDLAADGAPRLLPIGTSDLSTGTAYVNDTCTTPAATVAGSCTATPAHAVLADLSADACQLIQRVHSLGANLPTTYGYAGFNGSCGPITSSGATAFVLGPELAPAAFPATPALSPSAVGRLTRSVNAVAGTWRWGAGAFRDTRLDVGVWPAHASDGSLRWLPEGYGLNIALARYFSDFECATPLVVLSGPCPEMLRYGWLVNDCRVGQEIRPLTRYTGQVLEKSGAFCFPATQLYGTPYAFGDPIPPETFLPATIVLR